MGKSCGFPNFSKAGIGPSEPNIIPDGIGKNNYTPDIVAARGKKMKIVEVDTPGTVDNDQLASFRRSAAQRENADFEHVITKPRK